MADSKISALPASTTPLAGTEVLPIVQSSATKQVSVANLTAGRAISATQLTLTTGNLIVASGQGIDFSATAGTGTSELLADYEEGTWTPTLSAFSGTITTVGTCTGRYTKVGRSVTVSIDAAITVNGLAAVTLFIAGLPFAGVATYYAGCGEERSTAKALSVEYATASSRLNVYFYDGTYPGANGSRFIISLTYDV